MDSDLDARGDGPTEEDDTKNNGGDSIHVGDIVGSKGVASGRDAKVIIQEAPAPIITSLHQLPTPPRDFTGRDEELKKLLEAVSEGGVTISGLRGMGGIGKTALALVLAEQLTGQYPDAQFYLDLNGTAQPLSVVDALSHVVRAYHPTAKLPDSEAELRGLYTSVLEGQRVLLLMDNAATAKQVRPLIPPQGCVLLVTSRQYFTLSAWFAKNLSVLSPHDAHKLLLTIDPRIDGQAETIAKLCGYLPLALRAAASSLAATPDLAADVYAEQLGDERERLERIGAEGVDYSVEASLGLSYSKLGEDASHVFRTLVVFPDTFDATAEEMVCEDKNHAHLSALVLRGLVEWDEQAQRYRLHDLARLFADSHSGDADAEQSAIRLRHATHYEAVLRVAKELYKKGGASIETALSLYDLEALNIQAGQTWAAEHSAENDAAAELVSAYPDAGVHVLDLRQHPGEYIRWAAAGLAAAKRLNKPNEAGRHLGRLALAYFVVGDFNQAIEYGEEYLEISREVSDRFNEGIALGNLGLAYRALGQVGRAIEYHGQALIMARETGGRLNEGIWLYNLGNDLSNQKQIEAAKQSLQDALAILEEFKSPYAEQARQALAKLEGDEGGENGRGVTAFPPVAFKPNENDKSNIDLILEMHKYLADNHTFALRYALQVVADEIRNQDKSGGKGQKGGTRD